jgi:hypothetical protein
MGLGKYTLTLDELAKNYVHISESKHEKNKTYQVAVDFINYAVGDNSHARGYLLNYYCSRIQHYKGDKNGECG